ncbi:MAG: hypothetical protein ACOYNI_04490 [Acidimicrobiia bacterium]
MSDYEAIIEKLQAIEEELRDLALERLQDAVRQGADHSAEEKRVSKARRAIEKAIRDLTSGEPRDEYADYD